MDGYNARMSLPRLLLHAEGAVLLGAAVILYADRGEGWLLFALLALAPDLGMA